MGKSVRKSLDASKNAISNSYKKLLKKEGLDQGTSGRKQVNGRQSRTNRMLKTHEKAKRWQNSKSEPIETREQREKARTEKQKMRKERQKRLNKHTRKGQPVMKNRMELMLEKIMKNTDTYQGWKKSNNEHVGTRRITESMY